MIAFILRRLAQALVVMGVVSPWHAWLQEQYYDDLRHHIIRKNNLGKAVIGNSRIKAQIPKFLAGETDLTA